MQNITIRHVQASLPLVSSQEPTPATTKAARRAGTWLCTLVAMALYPGMALAQVAVTLPPLSGMVSMLTPQDDVFCLLSAGADPHSFQISPRQAERLKSAELFIRTTADDGGWPIPSNHTQTLNLWSKQHHAWLVPKRVSEALPKLAEALKSIHPDQTLSIDSNLNHALMTIRAIDAEWQAVLTPLRSTGVIVQHPSWVPLFEAYGVPVLATLESTNHAHEAGPHLLEDALAILKAHPQVKLIGDSRHSNRSLEWLARHRSDTAPVIQLDGLGECGLPWEALMRNNINKLKP